MGIFVLFGFVVSLFLNIASIVVSVVNLVVSVIRVVFDAFGIVFARVASAVGVFARSAAGFLKGFWDGIVLPAISAVKSWILKFQAFLRDVFRPVFRIIDRVLDILDKIWDKVIGPILDAIDKVRLILTGLDKLGVPLAGKIEDALERVTTIIRESFRTVERILNDVINIINDLLDPGGWMKLLPWGKSVEHWAGTTVSILVAAGIDPLTFEVMEDNFEQLVPPTLTEDIEAFENGAVARNFDVLEAVARFETGL